jgi:hypothetical protein
VADFLLVPPDLQAIAVIGLDDSPLSDHFLHLIHLLSPRSPAGLVRVPVTC